MRRSIRSPVLVCLLQGLLWSTASQAEDWVVLNPLQLEFLTSYDARFLDSGGIEDSSSILQTGVGITQEGYSIDPDLFRFSAQLEPLYTLVALERNGQSGTVDDVVTNYDVKFWVLGDTTLPVRADVGLLKNLVFSSQQLGSTSLSTSKRNGAKIYWDNVYFPSSLSYEQREFRQTFTSGLSGVRTNRNEVARVLQFRGRSSNM